MPANKSKNSIYFYKKTDPFAFYANTFETPMAVLISDHLLQANNLEVFFQGLKDLTDPDPTTHKRKLSNDGKSHIKQNKTGRTNGLAMVTPNNGVQVTGKNGITVDILNNIEIPLYDMPAQPNKRPHVKKVGNKYIPIDNPPYLTIKEVVMKDLLRCKFTQNPALLAMLLRDNCDIIEDTSKTRSRPDSFWGIGKKSGAATKIADAIAKATLGAITIAPRGHGRNALGKLLVELRAEFRNQLSNQGEITIHTNLSDKACDLLNIPRSSTTSVNVIKYDDLTTFEISPDVANFLKKKNPDAKDYQKVKDLNLNRVIANEPQRHAANLMIAAILSQYKLDNESEKKPKFKLFDTTSSQSRQLVNTLKSNKVDIKSKLEAIDNFMCHAGNKNRTLYNTIINTVLPHHPEGAQQLRRLNLYFENKSFAIKKTR